MKTVAIAFTAVTLLISSSSAFAQSVGEKTGVNAMLGTAPSTQDFVTRAAVSDMFEIESSKLAQANAANEKTKAFAAKMVKDHTTTSTELKALLSGGKVKADLPAAMDASHKSKIEKLQGLKSKDFDKQYNSEQETAHKNAVALFERYAKGGDNGDLKAFAAKHLPHLQEHLKMAEDLNK